MSDQVVQSAAEVTPGLSQGQRITNMFTAPSKTFQDIRAGHKSWWLPFVIYVVLGFAFYGVVECQSWHASGQRKSGQTKPQG